MSAQKAPMEKTANGLFRDFYEIERDLFDLFNKPNKHIKRLDRVNGFEPQYKEQIDTSGKAVSYPPKYIRMIAQVSSPALLAQIERMSEDMARLYVEAATIKAAQAGQPTSNIKPPVRLPRVVLNASEIIVGIYPSNRSHKIQAPREEDESPWHELFSYSAPLFAGSQEKEVKSFIAGMINSFSRFGVLAKDNGTGLVIDKVSLLKANKATHIQIRQLSGLQYLLRVSKPENTAQERMPYQFIVTNNEPNIRHIGEPNKNPLKRMENIHRKIDYDFLPDDMSMFVITEI